MGKADFTHDLRFMSLLQQDSPQLLDILYFVLQSVSKWTQIGQHKDLEKFAH